MDRRREEDEERRERAEEALVAFERDGRAAAAPAAAPPTGPPGARGLPSRCSDITELMGFVMREFNGAREPPWDCPPQHILVERARAACAGV